MKCSMLLLLVIITVFPVLANAYVPSPRYGAFELKFGPYRPNADKTPGNKGDYSDFYGKNSSMFNTTLQPYFSYSITTKRYDSMKSPEIIL